MDKLVDFACFCCTWTIYKTFNILGGLKDIGIAETSGLLLSPGSAFRGVLLFGVPFYFLSRSLGTVH
jgi:hypothetical protein